MARRATDQAHGAPRQGRIATKRRRARWTSYALTALIAGAAAGTAMAATVMLIAEISSEPTSVAGIDSSTWTPLTAITAFLFGPDSYHASFAVLPIVFGVAAHLALSVVFGAVGVALIAFTLGERPGPAAAAALGFLFGVALEILVLNLVVNAIQSDNMVYESLPQWGWWAGHAAYGTTLGLVTARVMYLLMPAAPPDPERPPQGTAAASAR